MGILQQPGPSQIVSPAAASAREPVSEWWWYPANPDTRNQEFEAVTLPAGYAWWQDPVGAVGPLVAHAAVNNVALTMDSSPATFVRYKIHTDRRRSWMECQVPQTGPAGGGIPYTGIGYYLLTPITFGANECMWTRTGLPIIWLTGGSGVAGPCCYLVVMGSAAGIPDRNTALMIGYEGQVNVGGNLNGNFFVVSTGASALNPAGSFEFSQGAIAGLGYRRRASSNWTGMMMGIDLTRQFLEFTQASIGGSFATFTPTHIGWKFRANNAQGYNPIFETDFLRFSPSADALPL